MKTPGWRAPIPVLAAVLALLALALVLTIVAGYWQTAAETPTAASAARAAAEQPIDAQREPGAMLDRLGAYLEKPPSDARALVLHARRLAEAQRYGEAAQAYEKALALPSKVPKDPGVWCEYADALAMTQHGQLAGKPRQLIDKALALNPDHPKALELAGSAEYEQGNYLAALQFWRPLLAQLKPGSRMHEELAAAIARSERSEHPGATSGQRF